MRGIRRNVVFRAGASCDSFAFFWRALLLRRCEPGGSVLKCGSFSLISGEDTVIFLRDHPLFNGLSHIRPPNTIYCGSRCSLFCGSLGTNWLFGSQGLPAHDLGGISQEARADLEVKMGLLRRGSLTN